jgi:nucleoid-associated protein YgaU
VKKHILALSAVALSAGFVGCRGPAMASRSFTDEEAFWARSIQTSYIGWRVPALPPVRSDAGWTAAPTAVAPVALGQPSALGFDGAFLPPISASSNATEEVELVPVDRAPAAASGAGVEQVYTVQKGDTLGAIARKYYGNANAWQRILERNRDLLSSPTQLKPGMRLKIPAASSGK